LAASRPVGPEQRHHHFIPVPTAEERTVPCDALGLEANSLIDATSTGIFREHTEPNSMCISILENDLNELHEQRLAVAAAWMGNDYALDVGHAFGRRPITNDGEADRLGFESGDEVSVSAISKRAPMLGLAPAADKLLESRKSLGGHHEGNIFVATANELQRIYPQLRPRCGFGRGLLQPTTSNRLRAAFCAKAQSRPSTSDFRHGEREQRDWPRRRVIE
jgi:hypothetical protein